jgi:hypothetical protein
MISLTALAVVSFPAFQPNNRSRAACAASSAGAFW